MAYLSLLDLGFTLVIRQQVAEAYGQHDHTRVSLIVGTGLGITAALSLVMILAGVILAQSRPANLLHADLEQKTNPHDQRREEVAHDDGLRPLGKQEKQVFHQLQPRTITPGSSAHRHRSCVWTRDRRGVGRGRRPTGRIETSR